MVGGHPQGGYNIPGISMSAAACVSVLQGAPPPRLSGEAPADATVAAVHKVVSAHARYWRSVLPRVVDPRIHFRPAAPPPPEEAATSGTCEGGCPRVLGTLF